MMLVVGLDGATFDLIQPWLDAGRLPVLAGLAAGGVSGTLQSTLPPITAPAWASFMTGKNPENHGVFDFFTGRAGNYRMVSADDIRGKMFWEHLSDAGRSVGVINVPISHPPRPVNGYLIPGLLSPDSGMTTFPAGLLDDLTPELGPYRTIPGLVFQAGNEDAFIASLHELLETRIRYALHFAKQRPTDFLMVHFLVTDIAQHTLWKHADPAHPWHDPALAGQYGEALLEIFRRVDDSIQALIEATCPSTTLVVSDHGFGPLHGVVNLNLLLLDAGLLRLKRSPAVRLRAAGFRSGVGELIARAGRMIGLGSDGRLLDYGDVDWKHTLAYSMGHLGQIYLNLERREPEGIVPMREYTEKLDRVMEALKTLRDPEGKPLPVETFPGKKGGAGPDLHVRIAGYRYAASPLFTSGRRIVAEQRHFNSGEHRREGMLIACGDGLPPGTRITGSRIIDIAPTILHRMGVPVPMEMDGRVLEETFSAEWRAGHPVRYQEHRPGEEPGATLPENEQAVIEAQLRALGYMGPADEEPGP